MENPDRKLEAAAEAAQNADPELDRMLATVPTLEAVRDAAVRRNPDLKAALERWTAFAERPSQRGALPYPTFRYGYSSMFRMSTYEVMQEFPFPSKLLQEVKAAKAEARAARGDFEERENLIREEAAAAYANLFLARRELEIVDESLAILERFAESARIKYNVGTATESDVLRAEVDRETLRSERASLARSVEAAPSAINVLLDRPPAAPIGPLGALPSPEAPRPLPELFERALEGRPELLAARERTAAARQMAGRARSEWFPDFVVGGAYVRDLGMGEDEGELTAGVTLPLWGGSIRARIREAEAEARRMEHEERASRNRVLDEVRSAAARVAGAAERFLILEREVLPRAARNVNVSEPAYSTGKLTFLELLDAQRMVLMRRLERERALAEHAVRQAELERAVGKGGAP